MYRTFFLLLIAILVIGGMTYYTLRFQWPRDRGPKMVIADGDLQRGRLMVLEFGCSGCHIVASVRQARGRVGPNLENIREQIYLAGILPNQPDNMVQWLMNPREISPQTAMPDLHVSEQDARDIGAFLYMGSRYRMSQAADNATH